jgi:hypothetical protein
MDNDNNQNNNSGFGQNNSNFGQNTTGFGATSGTDRGTNPAGFNPGGGSTHTDAETCAHCGASIGEGQNRGLEQFLGKIGISDDMVQTLRSSLQNVDVEEYLNTAREYLKTGTTKSGNFAKQNPGKIAAGVAVLAVGAGLLISSLRERDTETTRIDVIRDENDKGRDRI